MLLHQRRQALGQDFAHELPDLARNARIERALREAERMKMGTLFQAPPRITWRVQLTSVQALPSEGAST